MPKQISTERLILRPITACDFTFMRTLHSNEDVMKYIGNGFPRSEEETLTALNKYLDLEKENPLLGGWIAVLKDTKEEVGNLIIRFPATMEPLEGYEIGYSFSPEHWGKGYATEASKGIVDYINLEFGDVTIIALIDSNNHASRNTLSKLGFMPSGFSSYLDPSTGEMKPTEVLSKTRRGSS